ncbi:MAG TPA: sodium-translocating pyrophosphatase [Clostridiales bacterium]|nr:sodium-translocating pyrophosphatase [Clostridiales bacterium]
METFFTINTTVWLTLAAGLLALIFALVHVKRVTSEAPGNERMQEIGSAIHEGAMAFLKGEYKVLIIVVLVLVGIIVAAGFATGNGEQTLNPLTAIPYLIGAVCSVLAGNFGMRIATKANVRTANAAQRGTNAALRVAFSGGAVMGLCVVGLGLVGIGITLMIFYILMPDMSEVTRASVVNGFALGASSVALFGRVGGGIYTKAADVGADLVGKVEAGIPEDDPRNPATIADNVGDNVGDVAGMGSDLYESYCGSIIAAIALGASLFHGSTIGIVVPLLLAATGVVASVIGTFFVRTGEGANAQKALNLGSGIAMLLAVIAAFFVCMLLPEADYDLTFPVAFKYGAFIAVASGLAAGFLIGKLTEYYTSFDYKPVKKIAGSCETGTATNIISGVATGMLSTALPVIVVAIAILVSYHFASLYGIALAAIGMLSTTGIIVAVDAYGPVADNAGGIAEMSEMDPHIREITDALDAVGNTTAAIGKGFAIGSAALTALALFSAYTQAMGMDTINILNPKVVAGLFIGGMLPFLFSALTMQAVGRAAGQMIEEVRRQFKTIPGIMEGTGRPDYARCVSISTHAALKEMIIPGLLAIFAPLIVGLLPFLGAEALGGLLAGSLVTGFLLAVMMANAGGAWDNAKKYIEMGNYGGKGSDAHAAAVNGDTVGDPFKDTSGPSLNILMKLMTIVALVFAPMFM